MGEFIRSKKGRIIIAVIIAVIAAVTAVIILLGGGEESYRSIRISELFGTVEMKSRDGEFAPYENMYLEDGITLRTETDSYTRMILDSDKYVKLEQLSQAQFVELGGGKNPSTVIRLDKGSITNELTEPLGKNERYVVNTPNSVMAVRGTYFRVDVKVDDNGDAYTDIFTYGGTVACQRVMPDGEIVEEEVLVKDGYKTTIKMDTKETVYIEEKIDEQGDNVDPIDISDIPDDDLVDIYNASVNGHEMFNGSQELWEEIKEREIPVEEYHSPYDGEKIPDFENDANFQPY